MINQQANPFVQPPSIVKRDLLDGKTAEERKTYPVATGFMGYFRDAIFRVAHVSYIGNAQHNLGQETHWARGKSTDQLDCVARHTMEALDINDMSDATEEALASMTWRANAQLQLYLEKKYNIKPPPSCK